MHVFLKPGNTDWPTSIKWLIQLAYLVQFFWTYLNFSLQARFRRYRKDKLWLAKNSARYSDGFDPSAHPAREQLGLQDQRRHSQGIHEDDEQRLPLTLRRDFGSYQASIWSALG